MKHLTNKRFTKVFSMFMAAVLMMCSFSVSAFACETDNIDSESLDGLIAIDENHPNYQEALEVLNVSEEEAKSSQIYQVDIGNNGQSTNDVRVPGTGRPYYFSTFSFTKSNRGSYWICDGVKLRWGVYWRGTVDDSTGLRLQIQLYKYPCGAADLLDQVWLFNDSNGQRYESKDIFVTRGTELKFHYYCDYFWETTTLEPQATVSMYVIVSNPFYYG